MKLSGWVYLLVGALMIGYVEFIEGRTEEGSLVFFFWVAVALILYGIGKESIGRLSKKPKEKELVGPPKHEEHVHDHRHPAGHQFHGKSHHESHRHTRPEGHRHTSHPHQASVTCPRCHTTSPGHRKFCHNCSFQLRH